jgi:hypothetical protein
LLRQKVPSGEHFGAPIDNFSSITCLNYNEVQALTNDTAIASGQCIPLNAVALGAYDSAFWKTADGEFISSNLNGVEVCPVGFEEYVVYMRSTDCGNFWSYDTVRVNQPNSIAATKPFEVSLAPSFNCSGKEFQLSCNERCVLDVFDISGRKVEMLTFNQGKHQFQLNRLVDGVYVCKIQSHQGVVSKRVVLQPCY